MIGSASHRSPMDTPQVYRPRTLTPEMVAAENARFMTYVYGWMTAGLCLTGAVAWYIVQDEQLAISLVTNRLLFWVLIIAQLGAVFALAGLIKGINATTAAVIYFAYAALTGM